MIPHEDALLLQFMYGDHLNGALFRIFAAEYGPQICSAGLRHAVLAYASVRLCEKLSPTLIHNRTVEYTSLARKTLLKTLEFPARLTEADIFAAHLLALTSYELENVAEAALHTKGCMAIIEYRDAVLVPTMKNNIAPSDIWTIFGPLVYDQSARLTIHSDISNLSFSGGVRTASLNQRIRYRSLLAQRYDGTPLLESNLFLAMHNTVASVLRMEAHLLGRLAMKPDSGITLKAHLLGFAEDELSSLKSRLDTLRDSHGLDLLGNPSAQSFLAILLCCTELAGLIIEGRSLRLGFSSPETSALSLELVSMCRQELNDDLKKRFWHDYSLIILLIALSLSEHQTDERK